jgi:hypothetical protein
MTESEEGAAFLSNVQYCKKNAVTAWIAYYYKYEVKISF